MTVDVLDSDAPDVQRVVVAWLRPLGRAATQRLAGDPLPFRLVNRIAGSDDQNEGIDYAVVSIHTFATRNQSTTETRLTHGRMLYLQRHPFTDVTVDGATINVNSCITVERPIRIDYGDPNLVRTVGRYRIGLEFVPAELGS